VGKEDLINFSDLSRSLYNMTYMKPSFNGKKLNLIGVSDNEIIKLENFTFKAIHTPGHTDDSITIYFEDEKITLCDNFDFTKDVQVTEHFVSLIEPRVEGNDLYIEDVKLTTSSNACPTVTEKTVRAHVGGYPHPVYLIDYELPRGITGFELTFEVEKR
jgi:glyoxylase-like metal-dependent hydrolase (beta-lactamase superfamily II)